MQRYFQIYLTNVQCNENIYPIDESAVQRSVLKYTGLSLKLDQVSMISTEVWS